ncbi:MAG TPA: hypothetical protein VF818_00460 [Ktedonobacterales bacterium]
MSNEPEYDEKPRYTLLQLGQNVLRLDMYTGKTWILQATGNHHRWVEIREPTEQPSATLFPGGLAR